MRRDGVEFRLDFFRDVQAVDEAADGFLGDVLARAGKRLQGFVGLREAFPAKDGLDAFGNDGPVAFQIGRYLVFVEDQFADRLGHAADARPAISRRDSHR